MDRETILKTPNDVTLEMANRFLTRLISVGMARVMIDEGYGPKRVVFAAYDDNELYDGKREIMIAMEGSGCIFIDTKLGINKFVFIQNGFNISAAEIITTIIQGLVAARAALDAAVQRAYPQLQDQTRN